MDEPTEVMFVELERRTERAPPSLLPKASLCLQIPAYLCVGGGGKSKEERQECHLVHAPVHCDKAGITGVHSG